MSTRVAIVDFIILFKIIPVWRITLLLYSLLIPEILQYFFLGTFLRNFATLMSTLEGPYKSLWLWPLVRPLVLTGKPRLNHGT